MTLTEKISYIRGLADGLKLDESKDEVKVLKAIIELLDDMALTIADMEELYDEMSEQLDAVDEDLADLEEDFYEDDCCDCGCDCDCDDDLCDCCCDDDCDCDCDFEDEVFYEVTCGKCGETICIDEDTLLEGEIVCPVCGEVLEFDFSDLDCCCGDDCECGCSHDEE